MTDVFGNELQIGDEVVFVNSKNSSASIDKGVVTKFYKNRYGYDECSVDSNTHILSFRIAKISELTGN